MQRLILISGFGGSGKSTCAQKLWDKLDHVAMIEADHLFRIKPFEMQTPEGREQIGRIKLRNSLSVTRTFIEEGFSYIIVEGLVWSQAELDAIRILANEKSCDVWCFWLKTTKEIRHRRAIGRGLEGDTQEFLDIVEQKIVDPTPLSLPDGHYHEIETDTKNPEQVVEEIFRHLAR